MYILLCPYCGASICHLTEKQFKSKRYLQGDEPQWCETCKPNDSGYIHWFFPVVLKIESEVKDSIINVKCTLGEITKEVALKVTT